MTDERVEWHCVADLMAVLMVIFLFISVVYLIGNIESDQKAHQTQQQNKVLKGENHELKRQNSALIENYETIRAYRNYNEELQKALNEEFQHDLQEWKAEILEDNSIRFNSPDTLFESGESEMKVRFITILDDFFPRYVRVLVDFQEKIQEIRIEGHTSSHWDDAKTYDEIFLNNSNLSQERAHVVLKHCFKTELQQKHKEWLTKKLRANGLAFAKPIFVDGTKQEDTERSKRVEFRVITEEINIADAFTGNIIEETEQ